MAKENNDNNKTQAKRCFIYHQDKSKEENWYIWFEVESDKVPN